MWACRLSIYVRTALPGFRGCSMKIEHEHAQHRVHHYEWPKQNLVSECRYRLRLAHCCACTATIRRLKNGTSSRLNAVRHLPMKLFNGYFESLRLTAAAPQLFFKTSRQVESRMLRTTAHVSEIGCSCIRCRVALASQNNACQVLLW